MKKQYTATVYILQDDKVLLIFHKKFQKWLPPGGHLEPGELPSEGAIREAKEETGLEIEIIPQENIWIEKRWNGGSFERPYLCLIENIPARPGEEAHQHVDFIYIGKPVGGLENLNEEETSGLRWFTKEDLLSLLPGCDSFQEVIEICNQVIDNKELPYHPASCVR